MDITEVRDALRNFLGADRFRHFISQRIKRGRLRFWQEQEWRRFTDAHPTFAITMEELAIVMRICELHEVELLHGTRVLKRGNVDFSPESMELERRLYPNALGGSITTEGAPYDGEPIDIWYCPECRKAAGWQPHPMAR